jgi:hypothetical protein
MHRLYETDRPPLSRYRRRLELKITPRNTSMPDDEGMRARLPENAGASYRDVCLGEHADSI